MKFEFSNVGVDSGTIMICDEEYYKKYGYKFDKRLSYKAKVPPGNYHCRWNIPETWNGNVSGHGTLKIESGLMIVSDPCYCAEEWDKVIKDTDCLETLPNGVVLLDKMGGDGEYEVIISLEKI